MSGFRTPQKPLSVRQSLRQSLRQSWTSPGIGGSRSFTIFINACALGESDKPEEQADDFFQIRKVNQAQLSQWCVVLLTKP